MTRLDAEHPLAKAVSEIAAILGEALKRLGGDVKELAERADQVYFETRCNQCMEPDYKGIHACPAKMPHDCRCDECKRGDELLRKTMADLWRGVGEQR